MRDYSTVGLAGHVDRAQLDPCDYAEPAPRASTPKAETVVGVVLAGGQGTRLAPLTATQAKPAVPFGARHRLIDFALSNLANSGLRSIYVLLQHHSRSVRDHLRSVWHSVPGDGFVQPLHSAPGQPFRGTADAVRQSLDRVQAHSADLVLVFGADHVYRMDVRQMLAFHRARQADVTVAALPMPRDQAHAFGVIGCEADGRIRSFLEKPADPPAMPGDASRAFVSMGNYCFSADVLMRVMWECASIEDLDFGHHVLPRLLRQGRRLYAYDFATNRVPGLRGHEQSAYWRDVGTLDAYFDATLDTLGPRPAFDLDRREWPIRASGRNWPLPRLVRARLRNAQVGPGALVRDASVGSSVIRRAASVEEDVELDQCIVLDGARIGKGARLRRAIVDRNAVVPANARIGFDPERDARDWTLTPAGITVVSNA